MQTSPEGHWPGRQSFPSRLKEPTVHPARQSDSHPARAFFIQPKYVPAGLEMSATRTMTVVLDGAGRARALRRQVFTLKVVRGPDKRRTRRVAAATLTIGSAEAAQFTLTDPTVSALHCQIVADE